MRFRTHVTDGKRYYIDILRTCWALSQPCKCGSEKNGCNSGCCGSAKNRVTCLRTCLLSLHRCCTHPPAPRNHHRLGAIHPPLLAFVSSWPLPLWGDEAGSRLCCFRCCLIVLSPAPPFPCWPCFCLFSDCQGVFRRWFCYPPVSLSRQRQHRSSCFFPLHQKRSAVVDWKRGTLDKKQRFQAGHNKSRRGGLVPNITSAFMLPHAVWRNSCADLLRIQGIYLRVHQR